MGSEFAVEEGEIYFVMGLSETEDTKLIVKPDSGDDSEVDDSFSGSAEFAFLRESGSYQISVVEWETNEPVGNLFLVSLLNDECCTLP